MAESGFEKFDVQTSETGDSLNEFNKPCDPCLNDGHNVESQGLCVDCEEYLCSTCLSCHRKTKASKHHRIVNKEEVIWGEVFASESLSEKCSIHKNEVIKFFCPKHDVQGCHDCIVSDHTTCDIDYIPAKGNNIPYIKEKYAEAVDELEKQTKQTKDVIKMVEKKDEELDDSHVKTSESISQFRKEINSRIDTLQCDADNKKSSEKQEIRSLLGRCTQILTNITDLKGKIEDVKENHQNGQLFIALKRAASDSKLHENELQTVKMSLQRTKTQLTFEPNKEITAENMVYGSIFMRDEYLNLPYKTAKKGKSSRRRNLNQTSWTLQP